MSTSVFPRESRRAPTFPPSPRARPPARPQDVRKHKGAYESYDSLPLDGILEFDYVVLKPRVGMPISGSDDASRLDMNDPADQMVAKKLRELQRDGTEGDPWINSVLSKNPPTRPQGEAPVVVGGTSFSGASLAFAKDKAAAGPQLEVLISYGVDHIADEDFHILYQSMASAHNDFDRLMKLRTAFRETLKFPPYQAAAIVSLIEFPKEVQDCIRLLCPRLADPTCLPQLLALLPADSYREELREEVEREREARLRATMHITDNEQGSGRDKQDVLERKKAREAAEAEEAAAEHPGGAAPDPAPAALLRRRSTHSSLRSATHAMT